MRRGIKSIVLKKGHSTAQFVNAGSKHSLKKRRAYCSEIFRQLHLNRFFGAIKLVHAKMLASLQPSIMTREVSNFAKCQRIEMNNIHGIDTHSDNFRFKNSGSIVKHADKMVPANSSSISKT